MKIYWFAILDLLQSLKIAVDTEVGGKYIHLVPRDFYPFNVIIVTRNNSLEIWAVKPRFSFNLQKYVKKHCNEP